MRTNILDEVVEPADFPESRTYTAGETAAETAAYSEDVAAHAGNSAQNGSVQDTASGRFVMIPLMIAVMIAAAASGIAFALKAPNNKQNDRNS